MFEREKVVLSRDVRAVLIPDGTPIDLEKGTPVTIQQSLGGTYTVGTDFGFMARIGAEDADALGKEIAKLEIDGTSTDPESIEKSVWAVLATCYDPEIPIDIVELGLVYDCVLTPTSEGGHEVGIRMTLTAPGCGMGPVLQADVQRKVSAVPGVSKANVEIVFDPPWTQDRMSEAAKLQLGFF
jgi:probable FeS assembly SUF system protein SufT